jgi:glycosyltransferase involved in cell wall biosynthesis
LSANVSPKRPSIAVLLSGRERFSPYYGGAVARWTYEVYSRLSQQFAVTVFGYPTQPQDLYPLHHETSPIWRACNFVSQLQLARRYEEKLWLRALIKKLRTFDAIHIHNRPQWVATLRNMGYEGKIILHLHNDHIGHWPTAALNALAAKLDALAVCSNYLRSTFAPISPALNAKTRVIHNAANLQTFFPREEVREPKTIFFVGRFDAEKGVLELLRAYEIALKSHPDTKLVIGGTTNFGTHHETGYVRQVYELAHQLEQKGAQIQFTGYLDHEKDLPLWFQKATIFCCPSLFQEPFGMVNAEAMACATTVVGSNRGGIPEVLGETGRLVDPENISKFGTLLSELLSNPRECRLLGEAGYDRCHQLFDWQITAENWAALLHRAMGSEVVVADCA